MKWVKREASLFWCLAALLTVYDVHKTVDADLFCVLPQ